MTRETGGTVHLDGLALLADPAQRHRPSDPADLAREAGDLLALGLSIPDAAQALGMTPRACADLLNQTLGGITR